MRVATAYTQQYNINSMLNQEAKLAQTQTAISSGKKSPNAAQAATLINSQQMLKQVTKYQDNINLIEERLRLEETTLGNAIDTTQRLQELGLQAMNNAGNSKVAREAIAFEFDQLHDFMLGLANTKSSNGDYIFAGTKLNTAAFTKEVSKSVRVDVSDNLAPATNWDSYVKTKAAQDAYEFISKNKDVANTPAASALASIQTDRGSYIDVDTLGKQAAVKDHTIILSSWQTAWKATDDTYQKAFTDVYDKTISLAKTRENTTPQALSEAVLDRSRLGTEDSYNAYKKALITYKEPTNVDAAAFGTEKSVAWTNYVTTQAQSTAHSFVQDPTKFFTTGDFSPEDLKFITSEYGSLSNALGQIMSSSQPSFVKFRIDKLGSEEVVDPAANEGLTLTERNRVALEDKIVKLVGTALDNKVTAEIKDAKVYAEDASGTNLGIAGANLPLKKAVEKTSETYKTSFNSSLKAAYAESAKVTDAAKALKAANDELAATLADAGSSDTTTALAAKSTLARYTQAVDAASETYKKEVDNFALFSDDKKIEAETTKQNYRIADDKVLIVADNTLEEKSLSNSKIIESEVGTYAGSNSQRRIQIGFTNNMLDGDLGNVAFGLPTSTTGRTIFDTIKDFSTQLKSDAPKLETLQELDEAMVNFGRIRSSVGARMNALDRQRETNQDLIFNAQTVESQVQDLNYAEEITKLNSQQLALQAAQQSYAKIQGMSLFKFL